MSKRGVIVTLALLLGCAGLFGCATPVGNYFLNRVRDFSECFIFEAGIGYGLDVHILCTDAISTGAGYSHTNVVGICHGKAYDGSNLHQGLPVSPFFAIFGSEGGFPPIWITDGVAAVNPTGPAPKTNLPRYNTQSFLFINLLAFTSGDLEGGTGWRNKYYYPNEDLAVFDVEVAVTAGFFSLRVGFSLGQFVDFLLGWFGVDIGGDDRGYKAPPPRQAPAEKTIRPPENR